MRAFTRVQLQASHDPLTGLLNRRSLEEAVSRLAADDTAYAVAFADLDHFKLLNDVHGHDAGDRALRAFAATLSARLRPDDLVGRWGGEEFVVVLPGCKQQQAVEAMNRVREQLALEALEGSSVAVTVSVGVAVRDPAELFDQAVARADQALHVQRQPAAIASKCGSRGSTARTTSGCPTQRSAADSREERVGMAKANGGPRRTVPSHREEVRWLGSGPTPPLRAASSHCLLVGGGCGLGWSVRG